MTLRDDTPPTLGNTNLLFNVLFAYLTSTFHEIAITVKARPVGDKCLQGRVHVHCVAIATVLWILDDL